MGKGLDQLRGRKALVTGASSGIGLCFARCLANHGCAVAMVSNQKDQLEEAARELNALNGAGVIPVYSDLTEADATEKILSRLDSIGFEPDILINNAGIFSFLPVVDTPKAKIDCFIDLHMRALTHLSSELGRRMAAKGRGNILNMSSMSCWMPMPGIAIYSATKAYIRVFSRSLNYELRDSGVCVTVACPGGIATDLFGLPENLKKLAVKIGALQTPEKFTEAALRKMLGGRSQYINGILNRLAIPFVSLMPAKVRMIVKHKMLDRNITRP